MSLDPIHPGEILAEEFMNPLGLSQNKLAEALGIAPGAVNSIVNGKRSITANTALRLSRFFGTTPEFWMNLQSLFDLRSTIRENGRIIKSQVKPMRGKQPQKATG